MLFANFVGQSIGLQNRFLAAHALQCSLAVAIVARSFSPHYQHRPWPSVPLLQIKLPKDDTFAITFTNTIRALPSPLSMLVTTTSSITAVGLGHEKQDIKFIILLAHFCHLMVSNCHTPNYIFMMQTMQFVIMKGVTQTYVENSSISFNNLYMNATHFRKSFSMRMTHYVTSILGVSPFRLLLIPRPTSVSTMLPPSMKSQCLLSEMNKT